MWSSRLQKVLHATSTTPPITAPTGARSWVPFETRRALVSSCSSTCHLLWLSAGPQCFARQSHQSAAFFVPKGVSLSDRPRCETRWPERPRRRTIAGWRRPARLPRPITEISPLEWSISSQIAGQFLLLGCNERLERHGTLAAVRQRPGSCP